MASIVFLPIRAIMEVDEINQEISKPKIDNDEILINLQFKTLVQISCTSRYMNDRILSPEFAKKHLEKSLKDKTNNSILLSTDTAGMENDEFYTLFSTFEVKGMGIFSQKRALESLPSLFSISPNPDRRAIIIGHSAGLVCLITAREDNPKLAIWNPSLSRHHLVPSLSWFNIPTQDCETFFKNSPFYAFGFNPISEAHEIVALCQTFNQTLATYSTEVRVYVMSAQGLASTWQILPDLDAGLYENFGVSPAFGTWFVNGHVHWVVMSALEELDHVDIRILAFELRDRVFVDYNAPAIGTNFREARLWGVGEKLCVVVCRGNGRIEVWRMKSYGDGTSWEMVYDLMSMHDIDRFVSAFPLIEFEDYEATLFLGNHSRTPIFYAGTFYVQSFKLGHSLTIN